jgi:hypothetical protein
MGPGRFWVLKLDSGGGVTWQKTYGAGHDEACSIQQTTDGGYIVAGYTASFLADFIAVWVLKLDSTASVEFNPGSGASTQTTRIIPFNSNVIVSTTSANATNSSATITNTTVTPVDTDATIMIQANLGTTTPQTQITTTIIIISGAATVAVVIVIAFVLVKRKKPN